MIVKICGINDNATAVATVEAGADHIGLVFYGPSPRNIDLEVAHEIARALPVTVEAVGLMVDPTDFELDLVLNAVDLSMLQLHGSETPERITELGRYGLPVMKAVPLATKADLDAARSYEETADWLLFDARPLAGVVLPGGNGVAFDWTLLAGTEWRKPWMLSGGLTPENVGEAIRVSGAGAVDVSSGVEDSPGRKNIDKIRRFIAAARATE